jgi:hypothetical protein
MRTSYTSRGSLKPTRLFRFFDIHNLYTMLPQEESLQVLMEFIHFYGYRKVQDVPIHAIRKLARLVLTENPFVYGTKFYRYKQTIGGAIGSAFTLTLTNTFMWKWERDLANRKQSLGEIYDRPVFFLFHLKFM